MKVSLLHDYLNQLGGGERVLETLMEMFPDAPIYTLLHDSEKTLNRFSNRVKKTSFLDLPFVRNHHRWFIPLMPTAANKMTIDRNYDFIISDTAGYAKGFALNQKSKVKSQKSPLHISYIHTPLRYAWEPEYISSKFKVLSSRLAKLVLAPLLWSLRQWDYRAAQKPDILIANSQFIANKIKKYYNREAKVIYPPVDTKKFYYDSATCDLRPATYYLAVGRLMHYKRFDLIIDAFAKLGLTLKIVGSGPEEQKLKFKSQKSKVNNIEFLGPVSDEELRKLYNNAEALIFPQTEDFGLAAAEAQVCGLPVIAYAAGGALEIIKDGETGVFFKEQTLEAIIGAIKEFEKTNFKRIEIAEKAKRFSKERFKKEFLGIAESLTK